MAFLDITPGFREYLRQRGLADPDRLLALPAVIIGGHPDRHVAQVTLGAGPSAIRAFVKREHRVAWKDRLISAFAGFGFVSRCHREFQVLQAVRAAGIGCPEAIAAGEDSKGRAFVLVRDLAGALDLRVYLRDWIGGRPAERRRFARRLGEALARIHDAGFNHPDLKAKHVLVDLPGGGIRFLDWQRSRRRRFLGWSQRWRDLASLDATLADDLASDRERLACFLAYLRATAQCHVPRSFWAGALRQIRRRSLRLQRQRRIREQRQAPLTTGVQNLIWLDGEALCVTREFHEEMRQQPATDWRRLLDGPETRNSPTQGTTQHAVVPLKGSRRAHLVQRSVSRPLRWLWCLLRRRPFTSPELDQAALLFRLQRFGISTPQLLAVGQRHPRPWRTESFLLTEPPAGAMSLARWLANQTGRHLWSVERKRRRRLLRQAGQLLRRLHDAGYHGLRFDENTFLIPPAAPTPAPPTVVLGSLDGIRSRRSGRCGWHPRDLRSLYAVCAPVLGSRTDAMRFLLGYHGTRRLTPDARRQIAEIVPPAGRTEHGGRVSRWAVRRLPSACPAPQQAGL
jgi:hypothetical protein